MLRLGPRRRVQKHHVKLLRFQFLLILLLLLLIFLVLLLVVRTPSVAAVTAVGTPFFSRSSSTPTAPPVGVAAVPPPGYLGVSAAPILTVVLGGSARQLSDGR